jgi:hypothetical protein
MSLKRLFRHGPSYGGFEEPIIEIEKRLVKLAQLCK